MPARPLASILAFVLLCSPVTATWSIVLVDTSTGEVAIGTATCLPNLDLQKFVPVIVVGKGAAAAQSAVDSSGANRKKIFAALKAGTPPAEIIVLVKQGDFQKGSRQYGIVDLSPAAAAFTGQGVGLAKLHVTGSVGTVHYSIQGNVLAGQEVILAAQSAVAGAAGSLADRLMAGMLAAHLMGGDGRCSCSATDPDGCDVPPPGFEKSAHIAFAAVARPGDIDGTCSGAFGCANGTYWMKLNVPNQSPADVDPTIQLLALYDEFRAAMAGHPDGLLSEAVLDDPEVLGDGKSLRHLDVLLRDLEGVPIAHGGASFEVEHAEGSAGLSSLAGVRDLGDGRYRLALRAGSGEGTDRLAIRVDDGSVRATLAPFIELSHRSALLADSASLSVSSDGPLLLDLLGPGDAASRPFAVFFSASGSDPGHVLAGVLVPLNFDRIVHVSPKFAALGVVSGSPGQLDALSRASVAVGPGGGVLAPMVGWTLWSAWVTMHPTDFASNAVSFELVP
ncbi:MAG: DUF1028 domain-containing protein [Planctomycetota bacterium]